MLHYNSDTPPSASFFTFCYVLSCIARFHSPRSKPVYSCHTFLWRRFITCSSFSGAICACSSYTECKHTHTHAEARFKQQVPRITACRAYAYKESLFLPQIHFKTYSRSVTVWLSIYFDQLICAHIYHRATKVTCWIVQFANWRHLNSTRCANNRII